MNMSKEELTTYLVAQGKARDEWIWNFGVDTGINLRDFFTEDELSLIWITRHAKEFHDAWFKDEEC